jgi:hypothetical protein
MPTLDRQRLRIKAQPSNFDAPQDVRSNGSLRLWSGSAARVEVGIFFDSTTLADISNLSFVTFEIKPTGSGDVAPAASATPDVQKILASGALNAALTLEQWNAGAITDAHAIFTLSDAETNFTGNKWALCYATTSAGLTVTLFAGLIEFKADGGPSTTSPDPVTQDAWTKAESDARYGVPGTGRTDERFTIIDLTGGGSTKLNGQATTGLTTGHVLAFIKSGAGYVRYQLTATTTAEALPGIVRPLDYNASTNARQWVQV